MAGDPERRLRWQFQIVGCMFLGYATLMLAKMALVVASPAMVADPTLDFDKSTYGEVVAWGGFGALLGKLVMGAVADRLGGRRTFLLVLLSTASICAGFGLTASVLAFSILYTLAAFAKAACWPSFAVLIHHWFVPRRYGSVWGVLSAGSRMATMVAGVLMGTLLLFLPWRALFWVTGVLLLANLMLSWVRLRERPREVGLLPASKLAERVAEEEAAAGSTGTTRPGEDAAVPAEDEPHPLDGTTIPAALLAFAGSLRFWLICLSVGCLTVLVMGFTDFLPLYLCETLGLSEGQAGIASSSFPAGCLVSTLLGGFVYDRLSRRGIRNILASMLLVATGCVAFLAWLPVAEFGTTATVTVTVVTLVLFGAMVAPAYSLPMSVFSIEFGGIHCGVLIGLIDAAGYLAQMGFAALAGNVAEVHGWDAFLAVLGGFTLASMVLMTAFTHGELRHHEQ